MKMRFNKLTERLMVGNFNGRCAGLTTGIAFSCIGKALLNPGLRIDCKDHYASNHADRNLMDTIGKIICDNELQHFEIYHNDGVIFYEPFEYVDVPETVVRENVSDFEFIQVNGKIFRKEREYE